MNIVVLKGNLARDPEIKRVNTGGKESSVVSITLAVSRHFKRANGDKSTETTFVNCEAWDTGAETIARYCSKGSELLIEGCLKEDKWETKEGEKRSRIKVRINNFELPRKNKSEDQSSVGEVVESVDPSEF